MYNVNRTQRRHTYGTNLDSQHRNMSLKMVPVPSPLNPGARGRMPLHVAAVALLSVAAGALSRLDSLPASGARAAAVLLAALAAAAALLAGAFWLVRRVVDRDGRGNRRAARTRLRVQADVLDPCAPSPRRA